MSRAPCAPTPSSSQASSKNAAWQKQRALLQTRALPLPRLAACLPASCTIRPACLLDTTTAAVPRPADSGGNGQQRSFNYLFYIDFIGSLADPQAQNALRHLQARGGGGRVLRTCALAVWRLCSQPQDCDSSWPGPGWPPPPRWLPLNHVVSAHTNAPPAPAAPACRRLPPSCGCWAATPWTRSWAGRARRGAAAMCSHRKPAQCTWSASIRQRNANRLSVFQQRMHEAKHTPTTRTSLHSSGPGPAPKALTLHD